MTVWTDHIKAFAKTHDINYAQALKHADLKKDYVRAVSKPKVEVVFDKATEEAKPKSKKKSKSVKEVTAVPLEIVEDVKPAVEKKVKVVKKVTKAVEAPSPM